MVLGRVMLPTLPIGITSEGQPAELRQTANGMPAPIGAPVHIIMSILMVPSGSLWRIKTLPGIVEQRSMYILITVMQIASALKCVSVIKAIGQIQAGTGISRTQRYRQPLR